MMVNDRSSKVYKALQKKGFPDEFCAEVAYKYMNTEYTSERMVRYISCMSQPSVEEIVDEMFAIISDRDRLIEKHRSEQAQSRINELYRNGL